MANDDTSVEVSSSDLKNSLHEYLERVSKLGQDVVVTRYGRPIARISPVQQEDEGKGMFGLLAGTVTVHGDILAPVGEEWDADA